MKATRGGRAASGETLGEARRAAPCDLSAPAMSFSGARVTHLPPLCDRAYRRIRNVSATEVRHHRNDSSTGVAEPRGRTGGSLARVRRVLVIGPGGAGKSTFARELGARTGLPVVHLDRLYWRPGWDPTPTEEWEEVVRDTISGERWVVDGNYGGTMALRLAAADTVIFLDVPRRTCLRRVYSRAFRGLGRQRADLGSGCAEKLPDLEFLRWIWTYPAKRRPGVLAQLADFERRGGRVVVLRSPAEARAFLDATAAAPGAVSIAGT